MKKYAGFLIWLLFTLFLPGRISAEEIADFHTDYTLEKDGHVDIVERIKYDFENESRHGIYRTIPFVKVNEDGKKFRLTIENFSVSDENGASYRFVQSTEGGLTKLQIGDPNRTVSGMHTYVISYRVGGALTYFSDHDEFYWNVTGEGWSVPIREADVRVIFPGALSPESVTTACYTGAGGSRISNCTGSFANGVATIALTDPLGAYEGLTIVLGFPKNTVAELNPVPVISFFDTPIGKIVRVLLFITGTVVGILWYIAYPIWIIYKWYRVGRDPTPLVGVASAWFDPPKTRDKRSLTPGETGALYDERADLSDIAATIVDLARRKYLRIIENKKNDFTLEKRENPQELDLQPHEKKLLTGLFEKGDLLKLKGADVHTTVDSVKSLLYKQLVADGFFPKDPSTIRTYYGIISGLSVVTLNLPLLISSIIFGRAMPAKTIFGAGQWAVAKSLRNFLSSQERQLAYQAKNQLFFEKLLPFAVAFGVEKIWAKRFADIEMKPPDWYVGSTPGQTFSSIYFVNALGSTISSFSGAATPTRSSSGFSSGFGGGGFSGGGGGGGGGGSW